VVDVPDVFAVVIGPSSLVVDGDVTFARDLDLPAVEHTILHCIHVLRERWPKITYVYLTPVAKARPTRAARSGALAVEAKQPRPPAPPGCSHPRVRALSTAGVWLAKSGSIIQSSTARRPGVWVCWPQPAAASSRAMSAAQSSISGQSRKSPSGRAARAAGSLRSDRSAKVSFAGSSAPKKTW